jgi:hypothetical protein
VIDTNTLDAAACIADVEAFLDRQYYSRPEVRQTKHDGLVIIAAWVLIAWIVFSK